MVEYQLPKLGMRVRFPSPAPFLSRSFQAKLVRFFKLYLCSFYAQIFMNSGLCKRGSIGIIVFISEEA